MRADRQADDATDWAVWAGLLGGLIAWSAQLLVSYALIPLVCASGALVLLHLVTLVTALAALAAGLVAWQVWEQPSGGASGRRPSEARRFLGLGGVLLDALFLALILAGGAASFVLSPCA